MKQQFLFSAFLAFVLTNANSCTESDLQKKRITFKEHEVYYEVRGSAEKTLVFIHGWTSSIQSWKYQLDSFDTYKVIAIDLPGNGESSKIEGVQYTMELFADTVNAVLKKEKISKAFILGHSMGFSVAEVIAVKYPNLCAGICSIDGTHFELPQKPKELEEWIQYNRRFAKSVSTQKGKIEFLNMLFVSDTPQLLKDEVFQISSKTPLTIGKSMIEGVEIDKKFWIKKKIDVPCLAVYCSVFKLTPDYKSSFKRMYPQTEFHDMTNMSHFFMMEMPYKINQLIADYLRKYY
jgi:pimeloyl-ACP methyl ester carboxylesterase